MSATVSAPVVSVQELDTVAAKKARRAVGRWLMIGVAMLVVQVALGGITRLTGSGLSIAEWKPILGAIPPMNDAEWNAAFDLYKQKASGQFIYQNSDFTLSDFKGIYFWEWMHREWARLIGIVFLVPFVVFLIRGYLKRWMVRPFVVLFVLGALQGLVGWLMVKSGLNENDVRVNHIRLAVHFMAAMMLVVYTWWFALQVRTPAAQSTFHRGLQQSTVAVIALLAVQMTWGAFTAGLRAAMAAPTWPRINGEWWLSNTSTFGRMAYSATRAATDHPLLVQAIHRTLGYLLFAAVIFWTVQAVRAARRTGSPALRRWAVWPAVLVVMQVVLGISSLLTSPQARYNGFGPFEAVAQAHQLVAVALLLALVAALAAVSRRKVAV